MVVVAKLLVLNPNEFELWKKRIEQYFLMTDYALWEVILNGDSPPLTISVEGVETPYPPTIIEEKLARKNKLKARGTLLMALLNEHQLKFNSYKSAKSLMEAIEKRFGEGLDQIYDRLQNLISQLEIHEETISQKDLKLKLLRSLPSEWKTNALIWRNKPDLETLSMDDLYNNLKIYKAEVMGGDGLKVADGNVEYESQKIPTENRKESRCKRAETIGFDKTKVECYNCHRRGHFAREYRASKHQDNRNRQAPRRTDEDGPTNFVLMAHTSSSFSISLNSNTEVSTYSKACLKYYETLKEHYDNLTKDFNKSQFNLGAYKASLESVEARLEVYKKNETVFTDDIKILKLDVMLRDKAITELRQKFKKAKMERDDLKLTLEKFQGSSKNLSRLLDSQQSDKSKTGLGYDSQGFDSSVLENHVNEKSNTDEGYHAVPPPYTGNFMPSKPNLVFADEHVVSEFVTSLSGIAKSEVKTSETTLKNVSAPIIEDWVSDGEDEDEIETESNQIKPSFAKVKFVKPTEHVKSPRKSIKKEERNRLGYNFEFKNKACNEYGSFNHLIKNYDSYKKKKMIENPVWNNARRVNHQDSQRLSHPHSKRHFVPKAVLTNSGRKIINTVYPRSTVNGEKPSSNVFHKTHSPVRRTFNQRTTPKNSDLKEKVNTVKGKVTTVGTKAVVSVVQGNGKNAIKSSACWIWRPTGNVIDHISKYSGSYMLKRFNYVDLQGRLKSSLKPTIMSTPTFAKTHNLIVFLEKPTKSDRFEQIVDFLNVNLIKYALAVSPTIYTSCIKQFWTFAKVKTINKDVRLQDLVDGKKVIVNEASIRRDLRLDDAEGTTCLPNAAIFEELARIGSKQRKETEVPHAEPQAEEHIPTPSYDLLPSDCARSREVNDEDLFGVNDLDGDEVIVDVTAGREDSKGEREANRAVIKEWDDVQAAIDADRQLAEQLQAQEREQLSIEERSKLLAKLIESRRKYFTVKRAEEIKNKPSTKVQHKSLMCTYMKNMEGHKQKDFKGKSFDAIKKMFDKVYKRVNTFVAMDSEVMKGSKKTQAEVTEGISKRAGDKIEQKSAKRHRLEKEDDTT
uniref:Uncharacterized protein n=1 Tax=Tanacetum cinerariifolium TaxID=118510 RepID=A0A6L2MQD0_TANCI|nr:hypothetical protein [Tanacetum cinerariifolium]